MRKYHKILVCSLTALLLAACHQAPSPSQQIEIQSSEASAITPNSSEESGAKQSAAMPVTTKYYSLALPEDWAVLFGPVSKLGATHFQLADKTKTSTVSITVGPSQAGDAERMAKHIAQRFQTNAEKHNGQWQCVFKSDKGAGYSIVREDKNKALLMVITVSGDTSKAEFIFQMRSPYAALLPQKI